MPVLVSESLSDWLLCAVTASNRQVFGVRSSHMFATARRFKRAGARKPISAAAALPAWRMSEPWQRWEVRKPRYAQLWTSCEKSNFQQLFFFFFTPPEWNSKHAAKNTTVLSFSLHLLLFQSLVYTSSTLVCSSRLEERALSAGVSMATGMRLLSKVRVRTLGGVQGRNCLLLFHPAAEPRCRPPPRSSRLQQAR